jgi:hypothetical protein
MSADCAHGIGHPQKCQVKNPSINDCESNNPSPSQGHENDTTSPYFNFSEFPPGNLCHSSERPPPTAETGGSEMDLVEFLDHGGTLSGTIGPLDQTQGVENDGFAFSEAGELVPRLGQGFLECTSYNVWNEGCWSDGNLQPKPILTKQVNSLATERTLHSRGHLPTASHQLLPMDLIGNSVQQQEPTFEASMSRDNTVNPARLISTPSFRDVAFGYSPLSNSLPTACDDNGHDDNGHDDNGHDDNGHDDNGHDDNGHDDNGHDDNGRDDNGRDDTSSNSSGSDIPGEGESEDKEYRISGHVNGDKICMKARLENVRQSWISLGAAKRLKQNSRGKIMIVPPAKKSIRRNQSSHTFTDRMWFMPLYIHELPGNMPQLTGPILLRVEVEKMGLDETAEVFVMGLKAQAKLGLAGSTPVGLGRGLRLTDSVRTNPSETACKHSKSRGHPALSVGRGWDTLANEYMCDTAPAEPTNRLTSLRTQSNPDVFSMFEPSTASHATTSFTTGSHGQATSRVEDTDKDEKMPKASNIQ